MSDDGRIVAEIAGEGGEILGGDETGTGAVEEEVGPGKDVGEIGVRGGAVGADGALGDLERGEKPVLHRDDLLGEIGGGPEADIGRGKVLFNQREHAGRVPDVTDVDHLPSEAEEDARGAPGGGAGVDS
jgi:hypothetical protein